MKRIGNEIRATIEKFRKILPNPNAILCITRVTVSLTRLHTMSKWQITLET